MAGSTCSRPIFTVDNTPHRNIGPRLTRFDGGEICPKRSEKPVPLGWVATGQEQNLTAPAGKHHVEIDDVGIERRADIHTIARAQHFAGDTELDTAGAR